MYEDADRGVIREYMNEGRQPAGEPLVVKIYLTTVAGDPATGTAKTFTWNEYKDFGVVTSITQNDIMYSGGIYQVGDIRVQMQREMRPIDDSTQCPGDRIVWRGHEYRQVGRISTQYLESYVLFDYVMRRI